MSPGSPAGCAAGSVLDMIRSVTAVVMGGGVRIKIDVWEPYRERFFAIFVNGIWTGQNLYAPVSGIIEANLPVTPAADVGSIWIEEVGQWDSFDTVDSIPRGQAEIDEASSANRLLFLWNATYKLSTVTGDSQLSSIVITGARRGRNVANVPDLPQRGRLSYSITSVSTVYIVRWWADDRLVAEGSRDGIGAITCSERNSSGLSVTADLTYSADVKVGTAFIDVKWPKSYQIHYSTSSLSYPRTPEATKNDDGTETYEQPTAALAAGSYNYNVIPVDDEGDEQSAPSAPSDSPLTIVAPPAAPTITSVTGSATGGLTVNWTAGVAGCTYMVYFSPVNEPINRGSRATPAPVGPSAVNATSASIGTISGYAPVDRTTDYATCVSTFDFEVSTANTAFITYTGFSAALTTLETSILTAISTFGGVLNLEFAKIKEQVSRQIASVKAITDSVEGTGASASDGKDEIGPHFSTLLQMLGSILSGNSGRYAIGAGFLPGGQPPGTGTATGASLDGTSGLSSISFGDSLYDAAQPLIKNSRIRVIVRATLSSIQETNDAEYEVEFDASGAIVAARPNEAEVQSITVSGLGITAKAGVINDDSAGVATVMDLYVIAVGSSIVVGSPSASVALPTALAGYQSVNVSFTVGGSGWYQVVVMARTAGGVRSEKYKTLLRYFSTDTPDAVSNLSGKVIRGIPARNKEAS